MTGPELTTKQAEEVVETKTAPRVTKELIQSRIEGTEYIRSGTLTICIITMINGFKLVGTSAAASAANYDKAVGERISYDNAFRQIWALEGYLLREQISENT